MRTPCAVMMCCALIGSPPACAADPADSTVKVIASIRYPNALRPWTKGNKIESVGTGVVIDGKRILTNAHVVMCAAEVYVQGRPGDDKIEAAVEALGFDVDLAVLVVKEERFFQKRPALARAPGLPKVQDNILAIGFPVGGNDLSITKGVVSRIEYGNYGGRGSGLLIQVTAAVNPGNSGGPAVVDGKMVGIVQSRLGDAENTGFIIPNEEIALFLDDLKDGKYDGKPMDAAFTSYQALENPALRRLVKVDPAVKGVLVHAPNRPAANYPLKQFDILTKIGSFGIDNEGQVQLENGLRVPFTYLVPKLAHAGVVPLTVLRGGTAVNVSLPVTRRDNRLIPDYQGETLPYFIHGPLVFAPAKADMIGMYARLNPMIATAFSPLQSRRLDRIAFPGEELVVVTAPMFSHKIAKGYNDPLGHVVKDVNGISIKNLPHLVETLRDCTDEFLTIHFADAWSETLVFDRKEIEKATEDILDDNGIAVGRRGSEDVMKVWKKQTGVAPEGKK